MNQPTAAFDWDDGNRAKCCKHGVTVDEIEMMFRAEPIIAPDVQHSDSEVRLIAVGRTMGGRPLFVAFTIRETSGRRVIRPVSARFMHRKEAKRYEQNKP